MESDVTFAYFTQTQLTEISKDGLRKERERAT